jgi:hypothetical protein
LALVLPPPCVTPCSAADYCIQDPRGQVSVQPHHSRAPHRAGQAAFLPLLRHPRVCWLSIMPHGARCV